MKKLSKSIVGLGLAALLIVGMAGCSAGTSNQGRRPRQT